MIAKPIVDPSHLRSNGRSKKPFFYIRGTGAPNFNGPVIRGALYQGKPTYTTNGSPWDAAAPATGRWITVGWESGSWNISLHIDGFYQPAGAWYSTEDVATPDLVTTWTAFGSCTGTPVFSQP